MSTIRLADRLREIEASPTLALAAKAKALAKAGQHVADFTAGEPDFPTPEHAKLAAQVAIDKNQTYYTPVAGIRELREAIAQVSGSVRQTSYQSSQVLVSAGAKHALFNTFQALCGPGDEVLMFSPYWVSFPALVRLAGARPVILKTRAEDGFLPDLRAVRSAVNRATKAILINSPSNPTGAVIDEDRLGALADIAIEHNLLVISDEIYEHLVYPPAQHRSIVSVRPHVADQTVIISGVSKTYSMTGWRIGYAIGPTPWITAMTTVQSHSTSGPASISQAAALAALVGPQDRVTTMRAVFQQRRDRLVAGLNRLPGCHCIAPAGAFYAWCDIRGLGQSAEEIARHWLNNALVATIPGEGFGCSGYIRFSFATSNEVIDEGLDRLTKWIHEHCVKSIA